MDSVNLTVIFLYIGTLIALFIGSTLLTLGAAFAAETEPKIMKININNDKINDNLFI